MRFPAECLMVLALAFAGLIFWRLHKARLGAPGAPAVAASSGAVPLGQYAVARDKQWLLIKPGQ